MKKVFLIGTLLCVLCSSGSGSTRNAEPANVHEGHEWVDLGLPSGLKWATCNVGASSPEDYGDYYAWGDLKPMTDQYHGTPYCEEINISGNPQYDVARAKWGGSWRMPTKEELEELTNNCEWKWTSNGYKVTGPNGNSIFIPANGYRSGANFLSPGIDGKYWSATPDESDTQRAYGLWFYSSGRNTCSRKRCDGHGVRPVQNRRSLFDLF